MRALILIALSLLGPVWTLVMWHHGPLLAIIPPFTIHLLTLAGTLWPNCHLFSHVGGSIPATGRDVVLTIDDGPDDDTPDILALLDQHKAHAVFFLVGEKAAARPDLVDAILKAGHRVENHTWSHPSGSYWAFLPPFAGRQIDRCHTALLNAGAPPPKLFRAPAGLANPFVHLAARRRGLHILGWSARGLDGIRPDRTRAIRLVTAKLKPGAIILMHQGRSAIAGRQDSSLDCLAGVLDAVAAHGYRIIPFPTSFDRPR